MIKTIIFDFGNVFINLDLTATIKALSKLGSITSFKDIQNLSDQYEVGGISTQKFIDQLKELSPKASKEEISNAWNSILLDFPRYRLEFLQNLSKEKRYKLILLSNTNELHINWIKDNILFYEEFKSCFDAFYLSHEINLRKPNLDIFEYVIDQHNIQPSETLFIDDTKKNTDTANQLGIHIWNNNPAEEDIINLFTIKSHLF